MQKKENEMGHQYKTVTLAGLKADHEAEGVVETFVAVTGIKDNVNDIIMPGAFQKSLIKRTPKGVWHHNITESVSKTLAVDELEPGHKSLPETLPNEVGDRMPHRTKAIERTAVTPKTTTSSLPGVSVSNASAGGSRAGWELSTTWL